MSFETHEIDSIVEQICVYDDKKYHRDMLQTVYLLFGDFVNDTFNFRCTKISVVFWLDVCQVLKPAITHIDIFILFSVLKDRILQMPELCELEATVVFFIGNSTSGTGYVCNIIISASQQRWSYSMKRFAPKSNWIRTQIGNLIFWPKEIRFFWLLFVVLYSFSYSIIASPCCRLPGLYSSSLLQCFEEE